MSTGDNVSQLIKLHEDCGQSPWLDNITRGWIASGEMRRWIDRGVRGITSNPTIFQKAMASARDRSGRKLMKLAYDQPQPRVPLGTRCAVLGMIVDSLTSQA